MTLPCDDSAFFSKLSRPALALATTGLTWSSASRTTLSAWSPMSRCLRIAVDVLPEPKLPHAAEIRAAQLHFLERDQGPVIQHYGNHGCAIARRHAPLAFAQVVVEGDLRGRLPSAWLRFIEE